MFRRIELIHAWNADDYTAIIRGTAHALSVSEDEARATFARFHKTGLMGVGNDAVFAAWGDLPMPRHAINKSCRFYFTEAGWRRYGRATIRACQQTGQGYRVVRIKERTVEVIYRDEMQVAVRPRKPRATRVARKAHDDHVD